MNSDSPSSAQLNFAGMPALENFADPEYDDNGVVMVDALSSEEVEDDAKDPATDSPSGKGQARLFVGDVEVKTKTAAGRHVRRPSSRPE